MNHLEAMFSNQQADPPAFFRDGFTGPLKLFTASQCSLVLQHMQLGACPSPLDWPKGRAANDRLLYDLATRPTLLALLVPILGKDIVLWGVDVIARDPGQVHPWHTDLESSRPDGHFVSVWIGLSHTSRESALRLITRSHNFQRPVQQLLHQHGLRRGEASDETVLGWARRFDPAAELVQPAMADGEAILYDGRLWHSTNNSRTEGRRIALLLQYAAADSPVFIPNFSAPAWPTRFIEMRPPTIVVSGRGNSAVNRLVPPPSGCPESSLAITTHVERLEVPLPEDPNGWWRMRQLLVGSTAKLNFFECHLSVLSAGQTPHPPHAHARESLTILLDGELEVALRDGEPWARLEPNSGFLHPAYWPHAQRNPGAKPTTSLVMSWRAAPAETDPVPQPRPFFFGGDVDPTNSEHIDDRGCPYEFPTSYLAKLWAHPVTLPPGADYKPHSSDCDTAIALQFGSLDVGGRTVAAQSFIFFAAGEPVSIKNVGDGPARFVALEFHAPDRLPRSRISFPLLQTKVESKPRPPAQEFRTFWSGPPLSVYEDLSLLSLVARGQRVFLYCYDTKLRAPEGVELVDAREILPADQIHEFIHPNGERSPTLHSNLFRYEALRTLGGWYSDLDVILAANDPPTDEIYFAYEDQKIINNAVLRFPRGAPLMVAAAEAAKNLMTSSEWGASGPKLLTRLIQEQGLTSLAQPTRAAYPVSPAEVRQLFLPEHREELEDRLAGADFVHLWHQIWRRARIPKEYGPPEGSLLDSLFRGFGIRFPPSARMPTDAVRNWFREFDIFDEARRRNLDRKAISGLARSLEQIRDYTGNVEELTTALQQARWERDELIKSTSWRVTSPLRAVGGALVWLRGRRTV